MADIINTQSGNFERNDRLSLVGLRAVSGVLLAIGIANAVDETIDYVTADNVSVCVSAPDSVACNQHIQQERNDSLVEGIGSIVGAGALSGLLLFMDYGIRHPKKLIIN